MYFYVVNMMILNLYEYCRENPFSNNVSHAVYVCNIFIVHQCYCKINTSLVAWLHMVSLLILMIDVKLQVKAKLFILACSCVVAAATYEALAFCCLSICGFYHNPVRCLVLNSAFQGGPVDNCRAHFSPLGF